MPKKTEVGYSKTSTAQVAAFVGGIQQAAAEAVKGQGLTLDSATGKSAAASYVAEATSREGLPETLLATMDEFGADKVAGAILDSANAYQAAHGTEMPADLAEQALHNAYSQTNDARQRFSLDSASNAAHDPGSLQPNRAVVAIYATVAEAAPWVHYLPADIKSNKSLLGIMGNYAAAAAGAYGAGDLLDGVDAGKAFMSSVRVHKAFPDVDGRIQFKITAIQDTEDTCDQNAQGVTTLRGRAELFINGLRVGAEANTNSTGANPVNGRVTISGATYDFSGSYNPDTGAASLTTSPKLPQEVPVFFEAPIDFERSPQLTSEVTTKVEMFELFASPWRSKFRVTPDTRAQMANELGLDPFSASLAAMNRQYAVEQHYRALAKALRVSVNNPGDFNFDYAGRKNDMTRSRMWEDFGSVLGARSQVMVETTIDHGVTHLYVGKDIKSQWESLPREIFEPSGVSERPGIFRFGRLHGKYDCYYTPRGVKETATSAQVLAIGRATNVARNPVICGTAVSPMVIPLATGEDLKAGAGFYAHDYVSINPHAPSAQGASLIEITNLR